MKFSNTETSTHWNPFREGKSLGLREERILFTLSKDGRDRSSVLIPDRGSVVPIVNNSGRTYVSGRRTGGTEEGPPLTYDEQKSCPVTPTPPPPPTTGPSPPSSPDPDRPDCVDTTVCGRCPSAGSRLTRERRPDRTADGGGGGRWGELGKGRRRRVCR